MNRDVFKTLHVLVVGGKPHHVATLRIALGVLGITRVTVIAESARAVQFLCGERVDAVFCDAEAEPVDGVKFPLAARRTGGLRNAMVPLFLICRAPMRRDVERARDEGVTDVLTRPLSAATVARKLYAALRKPRPFIVAGDFFGPDRRSKVRPPFEGAERRRRSPRRARVAQRGDLSYL